MASALQMRLAKQAGEALVLKERIASLPVDPFEIAERHGYTGKHITLALALQKAMAESTGKTLPININGATAAVISDMGFDWRLGKGFFIISRVPGMIAHAYEEMTREKPLRKLGPMPFEYNGPDDRTVE